MTSASGNSPRNSRPAALNAYSRRTEDIKAADGQGELPYRLVGKKKYYIDELDVISFLEEQGSLRPLNPDTYNPASYIWKKISDIDPWRRPRLLDLMEPHHIRSLWRLVQDNPWLPNSSPFQDDEEDDDAIDVEAAGETRGPQLEAATDMLPSTGSSQTLKAELWEGKVSGLPGPVQGMSKFQKAFFVGRDGQTYGRVILSPALMQWLGDRLTPLYFEVFESREVLATEDYAQASFDYGDGQMQLNEPGSLPQGFPKALPHPPLFNDDMRDYVYAVGPGVLVGQTWQEGKALNSTPRKFLGEFVLVKEAPKSP